MPIPVCAGFNQACCSRFTDKQMADLGWQMDNNKELSIINWMNQPSAPDSECNRVFYL